MFNGPCEPIEKGKGDDKPARSFFVTWFGLQQQSACQTALL